MIVTVHRFCELSPSKEATPTDTDGVNEGDKKEAREIARQVEPEFLQLKFRLGEDEDEGFPQVRRKPTISRGYVRAFFDCDEWRTYHCCCFRSSRQQ